jgi:hypothetical protein
MIGLKYIFLTHPVSLSYPYIILYLETWETSPNHETEIMEFYKFNFSRNELKQSGKILYNLRAETGYVNFITLYTTK